MRKIVIFIILAVLITFSAVFALLNIHAPDELSMWQKMMLEFHFKQQFAQEIGAWEDTGNLVNNRYYGSNNGYIILLHGENEFFGATYQQVIGNCKFVMKSGQSFVLYAYKNGHFYLLDQVFQEGNISADALTTALELHSQFGK